LISLPLLRTQYRIGTVAPVQENERVPGSENKEGIFFWMDHREMSPATRLRERFHEYVRKHHLIRHGDKLLVAVSGGADSMVLLDLLMREQSTFDLTLCVAHVNHGLRGAGSDTDEEFVRERAAVTGCAYTVHHADVRAIAVRERMGIQEAARRVRYEFFEKAMRDRGYDAIATGHHADDNAETILLNVLRGTGIQGLSGIPPLRQDVCIIRPLLFAGREEIEQYAESEDLPFRVDPSNLTEDYRRNFLRHRILPLVKEEINPQLTETLRRTAEIFWSLQRYLDTESGRILPGLMTRKGSQAVALAIKGLEELPDLLLSTVLSNVATRSTGRRPGFNQIEAIRELLRAQPGSSTQLTDSWVVFRERDELVFRETDIVFPIDIPVVPDREYVIGGFRFASREGSRGEEATESGRDVEFVDADRIRGKKLRLRTWKPGDTFIPLGMRGQKKVSDFFIDSKIPLFQKQQYPVLETEDGEIVWLCGQRIDDRFKITESTRRVLRLEFHRSTSDANDERNPDKRRSLLTDDQ
jgi:tRNA(Ile)-lysidine synthase